MAEPFELGTTLASLHPRDTARLLESREAEEAAAVLEVLPGEVAARVLDEMQPKRSAEFVMRRTPEQRPELVARLSPTTASDVLAELAEAERGAILERLTPETVKRIDEAHAYPPDTAGGMMRREVTTLAADLTVERAIAQLRRAPRQHLHYLYVVETDRTLVGVLPIRELLLGRARQPICELAPANIISLPVDAPRDEVVHLIDDRKLLAVPVVDRKGRLAGVVTASDAIAAGERSGAEQFQKAMGAADESALSPVPDVVRRRLPWLLVNLGTAFAAASVVGLFEDIIARVTALAVLLPVVSGQGGNSGSQSLAVVMRGLALREVLPGTAKRVVVKEVIAGTINGVAIAVVTAIAVFLWSHSGALAGVIGAAMIVNMSAAALAGALIPLILQRLGRDPAAASAIILTTVTDIVGFAAFLGFAVLMSGWL